MVVDVGFYVKIVYDKVMVWCLIDMVIKIVSEGYEDVDEIIDMFDWVE